MNQNTKKAAVKRYKDMVATSSAEDIKLAISEDDKGFTADEVEEIFAAIAAGSNDNEGEDGETPTNPLADKLAKFDYENLNGKAFIDYCQLVQSLQLNDKYTFELMHVSVARKERFVGVPNTPIDVVGIVIKNSKPIITTKIHVKDALNTNGRLLPIEEGSDKYELVGSQTPGSGRFYLLKK